MTFQPVPSKTLSVVNAERALLPAEVEYLLDEARKWRPTVGNVAFDQHHVQRRLLYEGKGQSIIDSELARRYPSTWRKMSRLNLNVTKLAADLDATTYDRKAERWVSLAGERLVPSEGVDDEGNTLAPNPRAVAFDALVEDVDLHSLQLEAERRSNVAHTLFMRHSWDHLEGRAQIDPYWPSDVFAVPSTTRPSSLAHHPAILARINGPGGVADDETWFEVWRRQTEVQADGSIAFGAVRRDVATVKRGGVTSERRAGRLPWSVWHNGRPDLPYMDVDRDLVEAHTSLSVGWTNLMFILDMQAHDELVYTRRKGKTRGGLLVGGPGAVWDIEDGEKLESISRNPKVRELLDTLDSYLRVHAKTRRQNEDAYTKDASAPLTGVSRKVKNATSDKAARERAHFARLHEEQQMLSLLVEQHDLYSGNAPINRDGALRFHMAPAPDEEFEDPRARDERLDKAVDRGELAPARAAVLKGLYPDETAARRAGLSSSLSAGPAATPPTFGDDVPQPLEGEDASP